MTVAGDAEALVVTKTTLHKIDSAFGGAIYQETTGGTVYDFLYDTCEGTITSNNVMNIPLTLTLFSFSLVVGKQICSFVLHEWFPDGS